MKKIIYAFIMLALLGCEDKGISIQSENNLSTSKVIVENTSLSDSNVSEIAVSGAGAYESMHYLSKKELTKYEKSAQHGDVRSTYILAWHYDLSGHHSHHWFKKLANLGDLPSRFREIATLEDNTKAQNKLKKNWNMDDERYFIDELSSSDIEYLSQKANSGDKIAIYILAQHYNFKDKSKYIFWVEKSANNGDMSSKVEYITECIEYPKLPCHKDVPNMVKKWQMEYFFSNYKETK
jgi:TPR repeat protein